MAKLRKPFYRLDELCDRWDLTHHDFAAFVLAGELTASVIVIGVMVEYGTYEEVNPAQMCRMPYEYKTVTGPADLEPIDAWRLITEERQSITRFKAEGSEYAIIEDRNYDDGLRLLRDDIVIRLHEVERFEKVHGLATPVVIAPAPIPTPAQTPRGVASRYDWDAFWIEVCRSTYSDGLPGSQADLVRRMRDWFETTGSVPDDSTIKKKLSPLWRALHAVDLRQSA